MVDLILPRIPSFPSAVFHPNRKGLIRFPNRNGIGALLPNRNGMARLMASDMATLFKKAASLKVTPLSASLRSASKSSS